MSPNGDMPDRESQHESFALTNMVPQNAANNRHLWAAIESTTRDMAEQASEAYVVTGPGFLGNVSRIGNVAVPTYLWKAIYLPRVPGISGGLAGAWFTPNAAGKAFEVISIDELTRRVGIDPFPSIPAHVKSAGARFAYPTERTHYE
jgi:endonuclease G